GLAAEQRDERGAGAQPARDPGELPGVADRLEADDGGGHGGGVPPRLHGVFARHVGAHPGRDEPAPPGPASLDGPDGPPPPPRRACRVSLPATSARSPAEPNLRSPIPRPWTAPSSTPPAAADWQ